MKYILSIYLKGSYHNVTSETFFQFYFLYTKLTIWNASTMSLASQLMFHLQQLLIKKEFSELRSLAFSHLSKCGDLSSEVTLSLVLFLKEFSSEVVDKL